MLLGLTDCPSECTFCAKSSRYPVIRTLGWKQIQVFLLFEFTLHAQGLNPSISPESPVCVLSLNHSFEGNSVVVLSTFESVSNIWLTLKKTSE